jgi:hypothetical protein
MEQLFENLAADATAHNASDRVSKRTETQIFQEPAGNVAADRSADQLN